MELKETDFAWLAGIIDGEGSIGVSRDKNGKYQTALQLSNTSTVMMNRVQEIFTALGVSKKMYLSTKNKDMNPKWKVCYVYVITKQAEIQIILEKIAPYLVNKKPQAEVLAKWIAIRKSLGRDAKGHTMPYTEENIEMYEVLKELNKRGL